MADYIVPRPGFRDLAVRYVDMSDATWAEKIVAVNPDGSPITAGASANVAKATAAAPVYVEGSLVPLSVDLGGVLRSTAGGGGGAVDVSDRAARLLGVVYGSQGQQVKQTPTNFNLAVEEYVGATAIDPRSIRALTAADVVTANQGGAPWSVTFPSAQTVDVSDRAGRLLGITYGDVGQILQRPATRDLLVQLRAAGAEIDPRARTWTLASGTDSVAVTDGGGTLTVDAPVATPVAVRISDGAAFIDPRDVSDRAARLLGVVASITAAVDVSDRAARLIGVVYGSQAQQLKQTATNFNAQVEVAVGGTLIDPRSIRALTTADAVNVGQWIGSAAPTVGQKTMANSLPVTLASDQSVLPAVSERRAATLHITATAAVNTASTATLPAAGAGLFHYITHIELVKLYAIVGVANGAGVLVTSTNLPGNPVWTTEQLASPAGTATKVIVYSPATPLKSLVANTATTFVAPLQLQTIWRWNISYFTAV